VEVSFDIDANGIVSVTAKDSATGREQKITISGSSGLSKDDVNRMVKDAEAHAAEDKARRDLVDARNQAESLAYSTEKTLNEQRDRLPAVDVEKVEASVKAVREKAVQDDLAALNAAVAELQKLAHGLAEQLYKQSQNDQAAKGASAPDGDVKEGEVVDA
jgi:molecular chaperone DnaK